MVHNLPADALRERESIIADIRSAFKRVTRDGGISWNECAAIDDYASPDECAEARASDTDTHWSQLVPDPTWRPYRFYGGFSFIDEIGFRYYLPPTLIRLIDPLPGDEEGDHERCPGELQEDLERFVLRGTLRWTPAQFNAIARVASFLSRYAHEPQFREAWTNALESTWKRYLLAHD